MNIKFASWGLSIIVMGVLIGMGISSGSAQHAPIWPIRPNIANWDRVNCTFGEIHGGGAHVHGAIDIDHNEGANISASVVQPGRVDTTFDSDPGIGVTVYHEYPPNSGNEFRRTQYLHLTGGIPAFDDEVGTGDNIGVMGNHLHFVIQERINGKWVHLNPLDLDNDWNLRYHQHLEGNQDRYDPQVNDIYVEPVPGTTAAGGTPNGVASGFSYDPNTAVGLSQQVVKNVTYCRAHLATTQYSQFSTGATLHYPEDRLVVFGNIGLTANVRDVGINSEPGAGTSSGQGLTIQQLYYGIENPTEGIHVPVKYEINFDQIKDTDRKSIEQIFNPYFDPSHVIYGNNDFIELRSGDDTYLSPYPHRPIHGIQSNGIWFTKARGDTEHVFRYTPDDQHIAGSNIGNFSDDPPIPEAKYPDGEYTLKFFAQDDWGHVNRAETGPDAGRDVNATLKVIVDNFRPFVKDVQITSGEQPVYASAWEWNPASRKLEFQPDTVNQHADRSKPLHIAITTSEPMRLTTDAAGQPEGSMRIKLFARDPQDPDRVKVSLDWDHAAARPRSASADRRTWNFFVPKTVFANLTGGFENYTQMLHIAGHDLAGTRLSEYDGRRTSFSDSEMPRRNPAAPQTWINPAAGFGNLSGVDTMHHFAFGNISAFNPFLAAYGQPGSTEHIAAIEPVYRVENGQRIEDGSIAAGWSDGFGDAEDVWLLRLADDGAPLWQKRYGTAAKERATAVQQAFRGEHGARQPDGFLVAGQRTIGANDEDTDILVFKVDDNGQIVVAHTAPQAGAYRYDDGYREYATDIAQVFRNLNGPPEGVIVAGYCTHTSLGQDALALRLDQQGAPLWARKIGRMTTAAGTRFNAIQHSADNHFLAAGWSQVNGWKLQKTAWVYKMKPDGTEVWTRRIQSPDPSTYGSQILALHDDGAGDSALAGMVTDKAEARRYPMLATFGNASGVLRAQVVYAMNTSLPAELCAIRRTADHGAIVAGRQDTNPLLLKFRNLSSFHNASTLAWGRQFDGAAVDDGATAVREIAAGNGYLAAGRMDGGDGFVLKLDQAGQAASCSLAPITFSAHSSLSMLMDGDGNLGMVSHMKTGAYRVLNGIHTTDTNISPAYRCGGGTPCLRGKQGAAAIPDGTIYDFAPTPPGQAISVVLTLDNFGDSSLTLEPGALSLVGSPELTLVENFSLPVTIAPGDSETLTLTFTPDPQTITLQSAGVYITSNDPNSPYVFTVAGNQLHPFTLNSSEGGRGCVLHSSPDAPQYPEGALLRLVALPDDGFVFTGWTVNGRPMGLGELSLAVTAPTNVDAAFTRKQYLLAGRVIDSDGNALAGVTLHATQTPGTTTDAQGFYSLVVHDGWQGSVRPELDGYVITFDGGAPNDTEHRYDDPVRQDTLAQNYTAAQGVTIAGQMLTDDRTGLGEVRLAGFPVPVVTGPDGAYQVTVASGWSGTVAPARPGYTFVPEHFTYTALAADALGQDAVGTSAGTHTISGRVTDAVGHGVGGVALYGFPGVPMTAGDGTYSVCVNAGWSGTITPQQAGHLLSPPSAPHTNVLADLRQDYTLSRHYLLSVQAAGTGSGSVTSAAPGIACGTDCTEPYIEHTQVTLSASPDATSTFTGWSGGGCSGSGTCSVTLDQAAEVTAVFTEQTIPNHHTLTVVTAGEGEGTVLSLPSGILCGATCSNIVATGTTLTLRAVPASGSRFTGWSGGGCSGTDDCSLTVSRDTVVTAAFSPVATLTVEKTGSGSGTVIAEGIECGPDCEQTYDPGTGVVLKAIPAAGSTLAGWNVNGRPSGGLVSIDGPTTVTAIFERL